MLLKCTQILLNILGDVNSNPELASADKSKLGYW